VLHGLEPRQHASLRVRTSGAGPSIAAAPQSFENTSEVPRTVVPLWLSLKAHVELIPVMDQSDFGHAAQYIEQAAKKYQ